MNRLELIAARARAAAAAATSAERAARDRRIKNLSQRTLRDAAPSQGWCSRCTVRPARPQMKTCGECCRQVVDSRRRKREAQQVAGG